MTIYKDDLGSKFMKRHIEAVFLVSLLSMVTVPGAKAAGNYGPGVTDTEIKLGNTSPITVRSPVSRPQRKPNSPISR